MSACLLVGQQSRELCITYNMEGRYAKLHLRIKAMLPDLHYHSFARARTYKEKIVQLPDTWKAAVRFFNTAGHPLLHSTALFCLLAKVSTVSSSPDSMLLSLLLKLLCSSLST